MNPMNLKIKRIKLGLRQYKVAADVGIAPCRLSEIETGRREPSPELLARILKVLEDENQPNC
ncbi:MAG: helix-turn-helix transcriptional regulator [Planctomycetes bacterium]|nr:helix-turn-helix transcriptional regulator [Planctomycetota bacterium]